MLLEELVSRGFEFFFFTSLLAKGELPMQAIMIKVQTIALRETWDMAFAGSG